MTELKRNEKLDIVNILKDLDKLRKSLIKRSVPRANGKKLTAEDIAFLAADTRSDEAFVKAALDELGVEY